MRIIFLLFFLSLTATIMAQDYSADYRKIEELRAAGRFRSALEVATDLFAQADRDGDEDDMLEALSLRATLTQQLEEDGAEAALRLVQASLEDNRGRPVVAPVLHFLLGRGLFEYARNNQYRLRNTTAVASTARPTLDVPLEDWNLPQLVAATEAHLLQALEQAARQPAPLERIPALIAGDTAAYPLRPTLLDLLAYPAMEYLSEPLLTVGEEIPPQPAQYLGSAADFDALDLSGLPSTAGTTRRLQILQQLTRLHLTRRAAAAGTATTRADRALLHVDLQRLRAAQRWAPAPEKLAAALEARYEDHATTPGRGLFRVELAECYRRHRELFGPLPNARALWVLDSIADQDPATVAAAGKLRREITQQSLRITAEETCQPDQPLLLSVDYRNLARIYHKVVRVPAEEEINTYRPEKEQLTRWQQVPGVLQRDFALVANDDYEDHRTETWLPALPVGRYVLLSSDHPDFDPEKGHLSANVFQVTGLALLHNEAGQEGYYEVLDRARGSLRPGVRVTIYENANRSRGRNAGWREVRQLTTDQQGRFELPKTVTRGQFRFLLEDGEDHFLSESSWVYRSPEATDPPVRPFTPLFSDRQLYRPGQTVHIYGLTCQKSRADLPDLLTDEEVSLTLYDANGQEVEKVTLRSDEYSRFSHHFRLPDNGLTGNFYVNTRGGSLNFRVEEYKRPRFRVTLTPPDEAVTGQPAKVAGEAALFVGAGLDGAAVRYRVFREELRWYWWGRNGGGARELVASGETVTDAAGKFSCSFLPAANLADSRQRYQYVIEADITDQTGETHPASTSVVLRSEKPVVALRPDKDLLDVTDTLTVTAEGNDADITITYRLVPVDKPDVGLIDRQWAFPDRPLMTIDDYQQRFPGYASRAAAPLDEWAAAAPQAAGRLPLAAGQGRFRLPLAGYPAGHYRLEWSYPDGSPGESHHLRIMDRRRGKLPAGMLYHLFGTHQSPVPGQPLQLALLTAVPVPHLAYAFASRAGETAATPTAEQYRCAINYQVSEADRGGMAFKLRFLRFGRLQQEDLRFDLGWENKELRIDYATFRDKLRPGQPERWTLTVKNADGTPVSAAAVASMYDASLDQIYKGQPWQLSPWPRFYGHSGSSRLLNGGTVTGYGQTEQTLPDLPEVPILPELRSIALDWYGGQVAYATKRSVLEAAESRVVGRSAGAPTSSPPPPPPSAEGIEEEVVIGYENALKVDATEASLVAAADSQQQPPAAPVTPRTNLQETAFWLPDLRTDANGALVVAFDSPEALTRWKFRVLAHDQQLNAVVSEQTIVTRKELFVLPNVPRFLREGDQAEITARVNNMSEEALAVTAEVIFFDPETNEVLALSKQGAGNAGAKECPTSQEITAGGSGTFCFPVSVPEGLAERGVVGYRVVVRGGNFSDGEENVLPVLSDRTLVTVTQPFYLRPQQRKTVRLPGLAASDSKTLRHVGYTFQATTNPAWIALKALPSLIEYPYDCTEQLVNRYFAHQLAYTLVRDKPVLREVFRQWEDDPEALLSELEQRPELKNALLTETPWVRAAASATAQRARIATLFDLERLAETQVAALDKLALRQESNGAFPWFPGGSDNRYLTQYVLESFRRLRQLGAIPAEQSAKVAAIAQEATRFLDQQIQEEYEYLQTRMEGEKDWEKTYRPSSTFIHYLYARSYAPQQVPMRKSVREAVHFFAERAAAHWLDYGLYEQALLVVAATASDGKLVAALDQALAQTIMTSLRERAIHRDEFGMYWKYGRGYRWQELPLETHCRLLEAFRLAGGTTAELDEMRRWLLTHKRTNEWPTTKATAAAVFALLHTGTDWTTDASPQPLKVRWPDLARSAKLRTSDLRQRITEAQRTAEAASGAFSVQLTADEIDASLARVEIGNEDNELVWGGVFWQYTELASKVAAANDGPLTLSRELFHREPTAEGMRLVPITAATPLRPGDRVTVRLIVRSDRELDFVQLKDRRAATFEPVEQLSGYRYTNGLGYYQAPGDLATNFFIDHLPRGTYTLEYDLFATFGGTFSNGLGRVQCMYAPEFGANSGGAEITVARR